ncbi:MAG: hypothetical protein J6V26_04835 [Alistipes sp.]|nr:hypothetical protein [Alistipes sp.]
MKNNWLIMCAALSLTLLAGCRGDEPVLEPVPEPPKGDVSLEVETKTIDVTADGGHFEVDYTLQNPTEGAELKVSTEKDWVYNVDTSVEGVISFDVAASYEAEARNCRLELIYPGVYPNPTITVKQTVGKEHSIKLELVSAAATTITMNVVPQDKNMPYVFILGTGKYFEENGGELMYNDEALWASDLEIFESFGSAFGGDASTGASAFMYSGDMMGHQFTSVTPNTTYVAYAYGFDKDNLKPLTEISRLKITTTAVSDYALHFDFNVEVDGPNVAIDVKPQGYDGYYYYGVFWAKDVAGATEDELRSYCEQTWENDKAYYSAFFDTTEEGLHFIFNELAFRGEQHLDVELDANTEFILWAFGMNDEALMNTTPEFYEFKTGNVKASENAFTLSVTELYPRKATVKVETTNDDSYVATLVAGDRFENNTEEEIMSYILSNFSVQYVNGTMSDTATGLVPSTEYELLVFGAQAGAPTTKLYRHKFTTAEVVYADLDFSLTIDRYYDGSELAAADSSYEGFEGVAIVPITANVDEEAVAFYFNAMNALDFPYCGYEYIIEGLVAEGAVEDKVSYYAFEFDTAYTFFGVAEDKDGNFTKVWSSKDITFKTDKCSPIEDFLAAPSTAAERGTKSMKATKLSME